MAAEQADQVRMTNSTESDAAWPRSNHGRDPSKERPDLGRERRRAKAGDLLVTRYDRPAITYRTAVVLSAASPGLG